MEMICDECGAVLGKPECKSLRKGDSEHTYFVCPECGSAFRISTSDGKLRKRIEDIKILAAKMKTGPCTEAFRKRVHRMKEDNVKRSRELAMLHPLAPFRHGE